MMPLFRLAAPSRPFGTRLRESLVAVARTGAAGAQLDLRDEAPAAEFSASACRDLVHYAGELDLRLATGTFPFRRALYDSEQLERRVLALKSSFPVCQRLGLREVTFRSGRLPADVESKPYKILVDVMNDVVREADHFGVRCCLQTVDESPADLKVFASQVTTGSLVFDFDPGQIMMSGSNPCDWLREMYTLVGHMAVRDGRKSLDGGSRETVVGEGDVDWIELLPLLSETGYSRWLTAIRLQGDNPVGDLALALRKISQLAAIG